MKEYIHYGARKYKPELVIPIKNIYRFTKPEGGIWASDINAKFGWKQWNKLENFKKCYKNNCFKFTIKDSAKILTINNVSQLKKLPKCKQEYDSSWELLDFEKLSLEYDAIEIIISEDPKLYYAVYGWDCDSILIMNKEIINI